MSDTNGTQPAGGPTNTGTNGYHVGPGKPPLETRWKPGESGNPGGVPRGTKHLKKRLRNELRRYLRDNPEQMRLGVIGLWEGCKAADAACQRIAWDRLDGVLEKKIDIRARAIAKVIVRGE